MISFYIKDIFNSPRNTLKKILVHKELISITRNTTNFQKPNLLYTFCSFKSSHRSNTQWWKNPICYILNTLEAVYQTESRKREVTSFGIPWKTSREFHFTTDPIGNRK